MRSARLALVVAALLSGCADRAATTPPPGPEPDPSTSRLQPGQRVILFSRVDASDPSARLLIGVDRGFAEVAPGTPATVIDDPGGDFKRSVVVSFDAAKVGRWLSAEPRVGQATGTVIRFNLRPAR